MTNGLSLDNLYGNIRVFLKRIIHRQTTTNDIEYTCARLYLEAYIVYICLVYYSTPKHLNQMVSGIGQWMIVCFHMSQAWIQSLQSVKEKGN